MHMQEFIRAIEELDATEIEYILDAVIKRKRALYADWEIIYYARKKGEPLDVDRILESLGQKCEK